MRRISVFKLVILRLKTLKVPWRDLTELRLMSSHIRAGFRDCQIGTIHASVIRVSKSTRVAE